MPTHDFEKQVQQKMDELKFVPSEAVWQEVAKQIRQRRDRRRILIWWLLFPLVAGGSFGIYIIKRPVAPVGEQVLTVSTEHPSLKPLPANAPPGAGSENNTADIETGTAPVAPAAAPVRGGVARSGVISALPVQPLTVTDQYNPQPVYGSRNNPRARKQLSAPGEKGAEKNTLVYTRERPAEKGLAPVKQAGMEATGLEPLQERRFTIAISGTPADGELPKQVFSAGVLKADSAAGVKTPAHHEKKMEWVVAVNWGELGISSGFSLFKSNPAAYAYDNLGFGSITTPSGGTQSTAHTPSGITPGLAFSAGLSLRRWLGHGFSLEAGILYSYSSTSMYTGSRVDSATTVRQGAQTVASYYRNTGAADNYTNQYHFIELPLRAQKQLGRRSPLSVNTGLSIGRFIGSNALQYDAVKNIYYKDNTLFNKTQLSLSGGMDIRFWQQKPVSLELGPRLQYGMTDLFQRHVYGNRHLLFGGLEMRLFFGKK